jgi:glycerol-3-phosphate dehydrogenase (NAD(P)+)
MTERIGVIGAGSWGTTLADLLARKGHDVTLWCYEPELVAEMRTTGINSRYLPEITLSPRLTCTNSLDRAVADAALVLFVSPTQVMRAVLGQVLPHLPEGIPLVSASKGIELGTLLTMSQLFRQLLPESRHREIAVLSGPSFAREVARQMPTVVTVAAGDDGVARQVQTAFTTDCFRVYTNRDLVGVELGGAIKNVIAIAAGISDGLGFGHNTRAALITRGLAEMTRLGRALGADPATFAGLAGMGDLVLTCTGDLSRNRTVGIRIGQGETLEAILASMTMVAEGVKTTESAWMLARRHGVDMPIIEQVYRVLHAGKPARQAVIELMTRNPKAEGV